MAQLGDIFETKADATVSLLGFCYQLDHITDQGGHLGSLEHHIILCCKTWKAQNKTNLNYSSTFRCRFRERYLSGNLQIISIIKSIITLRHTQVVQRDNCGLISQTGGRTDRIRYSWSLMGDHIISSASLEDNIHRWKEAKANFKSGLTWPWGSISTETGSLKSSCHSSITWSADYYSTRAPGRMTSLIRAFKGSPCAEITSALDPYATVLKVGNQNLWEFHFEEKSMHLAAG